MAKTINTRIQLKYDTLSNWQTNNPTLLAGEIACVSIGEVTADNKGNRVIPPIMMKVGPGAFNDLGWTAAKAADVYAWAKKENLEFGDLPSIPVVDTESGKFVTDVEYTDAGIVIHRGLVNWSDIQNVPALGTSDQIEALQEAIDAINEELDNHGDIVTHDVAEFATAAQGTKADNAAVKSEVDTALALKADKSVVDGMYTNSKIDELVAGAKSGAEGTAAAALSAARSEITAEIGTAVSPLATKEELNGVKATAEQGVADAAAAKSVADAAKARIDGFLDGTAEAESAIDTLIEIQNYMNSDTEAFVALSGRVTTAEGDIDTLEGKVTTLEGLVGENGKVENAENADTAAGYTEGGAIDTAIKAASKAGTDAAAAVEAGVEDGTIVAAKATVADTANDLSAALDEEIAGLIATAKSGAEATAAADATSKANKAKDEAIAATSASINGMSIAGEDFTVKNGSKISITPIEDSNSEYPGFTIGVDPTDIYTVSFNNNSLYAKTYSDYEAGVSGTEIATFAEIATTGSIYDITEGSNVSTGTDTGAEYLIFNCGTATTII